MSELTHVLYHRVLGLPAPQAGQPPRADHNELTKKIDGNTDSNRDGKIDDQDKNGTIEEWELWQEVLGNRARYEVELQQLRDAGFEDPFEESAEIGDHLEKLFSRYPEKRKTEFETAMVIFRSLLPSSEKIKVRPPNSEQYVVSGLSADEGGLEIPFDDNFRSPIRQEYGALLPSEILKAAKENGGEEKMAVCLSYSLLLLALLRAVGIEAKTMEVPGHAYVIATLDGQTYRLDPARNKFICIKPGRQTASDRETAAMHYSNEGFIFYEQGRFEEALEQFKIGLELDPNAPAILYWMLSLLSPPSKQPTTTSLPPDTPNFDIFFTAPLQLRLNISRYLIENSQRS